MSEMNNIPDVNESWLQAEKMLDRHFSRKRIVSWLLILLLPALVGVGAFMYTSDPSKEISEVAIENSVDHTKINSGEKKNYIDHSNKSVTEKDPAPKASINVNTDISKTNSLNHSSVGNKSTTINSNLSVTTGNNVKVGNSSANNNRLPVSDSNKNSDNKIIVAGGAGVAVADKSYSSGSQFYDSTKDKMISATDREDSERSNVYAMNSINLELPLPKHDMVLYSDMSGKYMGNYYAYKLSWQVSVYGGFNYNWKSLSVSNDEVGYVQQREEQEKNIITPAFGMSLTASMKNLSISLGAEYAVYGEETKYDPYSLQNKIVENGDWNSYTFNYLDTDTAYIIGSQYLFSTMNSRTDSIFDSDIDTIQQKEYDSYIAEKNGVNHITYIEVPVMVSYNILSGRTGVGISGGISPGWLAKRSGYYLKTDGNGIESLQEIDGFRKFVMNGRVGIDFYYRMNGRMLLTLKPQLKANLNSIFDDNYGVKQKYTSTGILFGVSWMLN